MERLIKNVFWGSSQLFTSHVAVSFLRFISTLLIARYLGKAEYGLLLLVMSVVSLFGMFVGFGIEGYLGSDVAREIGEERYGSVKHLLKEYVALKLALALAVFGGLLLVSKLYVRAMYGESVFSLLNFALLLILTQCVKDIYSLIFSSHTRFGYLALLNTGEVFCRTIFVAVAVIAVRSASFVLLAYFLGSLCSLLIISPFVKRTLPYWGKIKEEQGALLLEGLRKHGKWAIILNMAKTSTSQLPNLVLASFVDTEAVAIYNVSAKFVSLLEVPLISLEQVLRTTLAREIQQARNILLRATKYSLAFAIPLCVFGFLTADRLLVIFFSNKYIQAGFLAKIMLLAIISYALRVAQRPVLYSFRKQNLLLTSYLITSAAYLGAGTLLTSYFGVIGFAVANTISGFLAFFVRNYLIGRYIGLHITLKEMGTVDEFDRKILKEGFVRLARWVPL